MSTIDGKQLQVAHGGPTPPTYLEAFPGLGMRKIQNPKSRGDFLVGVKIKYPPSLTAQQKETIRAAMDSKERGSLDQT